MNKKRKTPTRLVRSRRGGFAINTADAACATLPYVCLLDMVWMGDDGGSRARDGRLSNVEKAGVEERGSRREGLYRWPMGEWAGGQKGRRKGEGHRWMGLGQWDMESNR